MKNPCKKCLIKASCSDQCNESYSYGAAASQVLIFISLFISLSFLMPLMLYITMTGAENELWPRTLMMTIWVCSFIISHIIRIKIDECSDLSLFLFLAFGPFLTIHMICCLIAKPICKTSAKKV